MISNELSALYERDINKLKSEILKFTNEGNLWRAVPGVTNSAGNLCLHLAGNLQTYIGQNIGGVAYTRDRDAEFSLKGLSKSDLVSKIEHTHDVVGNTLSNLTDGALEQLYVENVLGYGMTNSYFLVHLLAHLSYHTGQINYIRRILEAAG